MSCPQALQNATLVYIPVRGRAEPIRLIFEDHGIPYSETSIDRTTWQQAKMNCDEFPFNQVPILCVNGKILAQQDAILRYITKAVGAREQNLEDETITDMLAVSVEDLNREYLTANYSNDHVAQFITLLQTTVPKVFAQYEHLLKRLAAAEPPAFIEGPNPSFAEYTLYNLIEALTTLQPSALDKTPRLQAWFKGFGQREKICAYSNSGRRPIHFLGNNNGQSKILD